MNMKVEVFCRQHEEEECAADPIEMKLSGELFFNPDTKSQAQNYECSECGQTVTVVLYPPNAT